MTESPSLKEVSFIELIHSMSQSPHYVADRDPIIELVLIVQEFCSLSTNQTKGNQLMSIDTRMIWLESGELNVH